MKFGQKITKSTSKKGKKYFEVLSESFSSLEFFPTLFASRFNLQFIRRLLGFEPGSPVCLRSSFAVALFNCWCIPSILVSFNLEYFNICLFCLFQNILSYHLKICGDVYHGYSYMQLFSCNFLKYFFVHKIFFFFFIFILFFINSVALK